MQDNNSFWHKLFHFLSIDVVVRGIVAVVGLACLFYFLFR
ncbi:hypothetical protein F889_00361 [Acinetobacter colistiniresistens]|uniref:Uncharacterized protein n=1 Tax=Acinetobacter colistiniresistens TaxID=280145 RepID=N9PRX8_9GAMM|nr:hypothetical protein F889_00361 [Acinetobacter colistiniresistens]